MATSAVAYFPKLPSVVRRGCHCIEGCLDFKGCIVKKYQILENIFDDHKQTKSRVGKLNPYYVNILLAGYDKETDPSLYYIDCIATLHKLEKGAFGHGSYFLLSMM
ncbi:Proteasome subunit beta type-2-A [Trifolium repens]|nr:Proteasome subunit beta type-2-A [Trifolium repens]